MIGLSPTGSSPRGSSPTDFSPMCVFTHRLFTHMFFTYRLFTHRFFTHRLFTHTWMSLYGFSLPMFGYLPLPCSVFSPLNCHHTSSLTFHPQSGGISHDIPPKIPVESSPGLLARWNESVLKENSIKWDVFQTSDISLICVFCMRFVFWRVLQMFWKAMR